MKVERKNKNVMISYREVLGGQTFLFNNNFYIKGHLFGQSAYGVNLGCGTIAYFKWNDQVEIIDLQAVEIN